MSVSKDSPSARMSGLRRFWLNTKRIFKISTKPGKKEYWTMVKISSIGIGIIGLLYYIVQVISQILQEGGV